MMKSVTVTTKNLKHTLYGLELNGLIHLTGTHTTLVVVSVSTTLLHSQKILKQSLLLKKKLPRKLLPTSLLLNSHFQLAELVNLQNLQADTRNLKILVS